ncbi:MAG: filamentous hemagglutinin N-terminal domain-containing protein, partial [Cyanobacteria bacterium P01_D01_bin.56]
MTRVCTDSLKAVFFNSCRRTMALLLTVLLTTQPSLTHGQTLSADSAASLAEQPSIGAAPNGVPLVDIAPISGAGVSHNKYTDFNIGNQGLILNNAAVVGTSQLGGVVLGNPNLTPGNEAALIINEVTSSNPSVLGGALEVHGQRADVVVANPNGITVDGLETINIERFSLTTGRPVLDGAGNLNHLDVGGGTITLEDLGLNAETTTQTDIIARMAEVMAEVSAGQSLNVILGRNDVDYDSLLTTVKGPYGQPKPALALDGTLFGAMQAGRIRIMATEDGVGVITPKNLVTNRNDIVVDANGITRLKTTTAATDIRVTA